jgi:apolipoprotein N-acyltransferase
MIQWYDTTGALGGSLWVLVMNILIFRLIMKYASGEKGKKVRPAIITTLLILLVPVICSYIIYYTYTEKENPYEMVVVQPNIDPYTEKFDGMTEQRQLEILLNLADSLVDETTDFVVCPETALPYGFWEDEIDDVASIEIIRQYLADHPNLRFVIGASTNNMYEDGEKHSLTARHKQLNEIDDLGNHFTTDIYYDSYNTALQIEKNIVQLYHKSKLVLGVEMMPYPEIFSLLGDFAVDLGGTSGGLGVQEERSVFTSPEDTIKIGVPVCYESIFGQYFSEWITNGAHFVFVITNDGWWEDTPGYRQHLSFSSLRAIETRRSIARSANTGISCFIDQKGIIIQPTKWWKRTAIKGTINANDKITFYVKYGDYFGRIAVFLSVLTILFSLVKNLIKKRTVKSHE